MHGLSGTPFYKVFIRMRGRCNPNPGDSSYQWYGKRGIKCLWKDFGSFKEDMYPSYLEHQKKYGRDNTTIERKNSFSNYSKENCRWATKKEQSRNTSRNVFITYYGKTQTISSWSEEFGWPRNILYGRFAYGWSIERAFKTPVKTRGKR